MSVKNIALVAVLLLFGTMGMAFAYDINIHGVVSYYSPYSQKSNDKVEIFDQNNNRVGYSAISGAYPHVYNINFTWNGSQPYTFKMKWTTSSPDKACWCDWPWNGETETVSDPAFPCNCQQTFYDIMIPWIIPKVFLYI